MSRILLADDSPHAQRMGERILREEGYEVVTVTDGETAMLRLKDVDPDLVLADVSMPGVSGYQLCDYVKTSGNHPRTRVVLTAGAVEPVDEAQAQSVKSDGILKKPFEASALLAIAALAAGEAPKRTLSPGDGTRPATARAVVVLEPEQIRAAVTVALDASMSALIDQITEKVLTILNQQRSGAKKASGGTGFSL
jgi:CheY-like chemotaxis protein